MGLTDYEYEKYCRLKLKKDLSLSEQFEKNRLELKKDGIIK